MDLKFQEDSHGILVTKKLPDGFQIIGRISNGKFYFGNFQNKPPEETSDLKKLSLNELQEIIKIIENSGPP